MDLQPIQKELDAAREAAYQEAHAKMLPVVRELEEYVAKLHEAIAGFAKDAKAPRLTRKERAVYGRQLIRFRVVLSQRPPDRTQDDDPFTLSDEETREKEAPQGLETS